MSHMHAFFDPSTVTQPRHHGGALPAQRVQLRGPLVALGASLDDLRFEGAHAGFEKGAVFRGIVVAGAVALGVPAPAIVVVSGSGPRPARAAPLPPLPIPGSRSPARDPLTIARDASKI